MHCCLSIGTISGIGIYFLCSGLFKNLLETLRNIQHILQAKEDFYQKLISTYFKYLSKCQLMIQTLTFLYIFVSLKGVSIMNSTSDSLTFSFFPNQIFVSPHYCLSADVTQLIKSLGVASKL